MSEFTVLGVKVEPVRSILTVDPVGKFEYHTPALMPNRWRRFWYWALLGWTWRRA